MEEYMREKLRNKNWYAYTVALCIAVTLYVVLTHLGQINAHLGKFYGYFNTVVLGLILAYLMNPLAKFFQRKVLCRAGKLGERWSVAAILAVITTLIFFVFMLETFIPQLIGSIRTFMGNLDSYAASMDTFLSKQGASGLARKAALREQVSNINGKIIMYLAANAESVINASAAAGKALLKWVIAFILSVYMLMAKSSLKKGAKRIMRALMPEKSYAKTMDYLKRCDGILVDYIVCSLFDSLIVGGITAVFMTLAGMQYVGMVSLLVAVTNLIPNFGPLIGGAVGAFILLLVNPVDALTFVLFVLVLQFLDGYVIKPRLFGNKLGVSGLLILASVVVCGNIWGITGILLAIPIAEILDFTVRDVILPELERRRGIKAEEAE
jgi:predicted PurR-regulated permease PerM